LAWIITYYVTDTRWPVEALGNWNMAIGFGLIAIGFGLATRWK